MAKLLRMWLSLVLGALVIAACSMQTVLETVSKPEERQFAQDFVANVRAGNEAWLRQRMPPGTWERSQSMFEARRGLFPRDPGRTTLVAFNFSEDRNSGRAIRSVSYGLVTEADGRFVETRIDTYAEAGAQPQVMQWSVVPASGRPAALALLEASERAVPWLWAFGALFLAILIAIFWALIRYSRRKRQSVPPI